MAMCSIFMMQSSTITTETMESCPINYMRHYNTSVEHGLVSERPHAVAQGNILRSNIIVADYGIQVFKTQKCQDRMLLWLLLPLWHSLYANNQRLRDNLSRALVHHRNPAW